MHHGYPGGLLEHSLEVAEFCLTDYELLKNYRYDCLNIDVMLAASLLHDIAKIKEYEIVEEVDGKTYYAFTETGKMIGHLCLSAMWVYSEMDNIVSEFGAELLFSEEFIDYCRRMKNPSVVIFITTLAVHNSASPKRPEMILQAYQSIVGKQLTQGVDQLPQRHVIRQTLLAIIDGTRLEPKTASGRPFVGSGQEWLMAVELCLDHEQI
jgi:hypothetical protein